MLINKLTGMDNSRGTGKSTARALELIATAIKNPGTYVGVLDHYGTTKSDQILFRRVQELVKKLELEHFQFHEGSLSICSKIFEEVAEEIVVGGWTYRLVKPTMPTEAKESLF